MGNSCGAASVRDGALATAVAVQPTNPQQATATHDAPAPVSSAAAAVAVAAPPSNSVVGASGPAVVPPAVTSGVLSASASAHRLYAADPTPAGVSLLEVSAFALDRIDSAYMLDNDVAMVVECLGDSETGAAGLFSEAQSAAAVEVTPTAIAELVLLAGGAEETVRLLRALHARNVKCMSTAELAGVIAAQQSDEVQAACATLPADERQAVLAAHALLSLRSCELYPYAAVPRILSGTAAPAATAGADHDDTLELDFNLVNTLLTHTRMRLNFLKPEFIVQLVVAAGRGPEPNKDFAIITMLQQLTLMEMKFDAPSELLRGVLAHRALSLEAQAQLRSRAAAESTPTPVPAALAAQVDPLSRALLPVGPSAAKLSPLMSPLIPTLGSLTPTLRHLQAYLSRFLPLLEQSSSAASAAGQSPEQDSATAEILAAYLLPFLKQMQPWIVQLRPYLAGLQPFFEALQPTLVHTHALFSLLQPFLQSLRTYVAPATAVSPSAAASSAASAAEPATFLLDRQFAAALDEQIAVLALLHPLLRQLHPLCQDLLAFCGELGVFLQQLQQLIDLLTRYQTLPVEADPQADEQEQESSVSSIAKPWFSAGAEEEATAASAAAAAAGATAPALTAPQFLARHGRFLARLSPFVTQLRPFASDIDAFVRKFAPFLAQLAPFYATALKGAVVPVLPFMLPNAHRGQAGTAVASAAAAAAPMVELSEAQLQKILSS